MNENEVKIVDELVAVGLTRDWLVDAFETPNEWTIDRVIDEFREKVNDPFWEIELLDAMFERVKQLPTQKASLLLYLFMAYRASNASFFLDWLASKDFDAAFSMFSSLHDTPTATPVPEYASDLIASYTIKIAHNGDLEAAMQDTSPLVASTAACRIIEKLKATGDHVGMCRAFTFPFSGLREHVAWHMGRQHVHEAVAPLIAALRVEMDTEVIRAMLWSLGILRDPIAIDAVQAFEKDANRLIAATAREAMVKLKTTPI